MFFFFFLTQKFSLPSLDEYSLYTNGFLNGWCGLQVASYSNNQWPFPFGSLSIAEGNLPYTCLTILLQM